MTARSTIQAPPLSKGRAWLGSKRLLILLWLCVLGSSLGVVISAQNVRTDLDLLLELEQRQHDLQVRYDQLLLQEKSLSSAAALETAASHRLGLHFPEPEEVIKLASATRGLVKSKGGSQ